MENRIFKSLPLLLPFLFLFLFSFPLLAQDYEILFPKEKELPPSEGEVELPKPPEEIKPEKEVILIKSLNAIILITDPELVKKEGYIGQEGVVSFGPRDDLLRQEDLIELLNEYLYEPLYFSTLQKIARDIVIYYREHDRPVVDVLIPEQEVKNGTVQVLVLEGVLGEIKTEGNKYFKSPFLIKEMKMKPGERFSQRYLKYSLDWLNINPFRAVDLIFTPGERAGTTDLILKTTDRYPIRPFVGYDNTGTYITDTIRWSTGLNWGNAFKLDQQVNFQFITSPNLENLVGYAGSYVVPLPWRHVVTALGSYATSEAIAGLTPFKIEGLGWQLSGRYDIPLPTPVFMDPVKHNFQFGFDFKQTNNTLSFGTEEVTDTKVDIDQFLWDYSIYVKDKFGGTSGDIKIVYSPGNYTAHNTDTDFQTLRYASTAEYFYGQLQMERLIKLPLDFSLYGKFIYQFTRESLQPSEELGVGGHQTVRGYQERATNGDIGVVFHNNLFSPPIHALKIINIQDELKFLCFFDYGIAIDNNPLAGQPKRFYLLSVGPGLRYSISPNFSLRFDYGFPIYNVGDFFESSHGHIGMVASW